MNSVLAAYLKDMAELMLFRNFTLEDQMIATVIRAKTLTTLGQLDGKRKSHLVRFLYEAQMITVGKPSVDLTDADLSNLDVTNYKLTHVSFVKCNLFAAIFRDTFLESIYFTNAQLSEASFDGSKLVNINFYKANLTNTSFIAARLSEVNFYDAIVTKADFTSVLIVSSECSYIKGNDLKIAVRKVKIVNVKLIHGMSTP
jgi:uncharacterized protein YjbI with pentapeptide repeats